MKGFISTALVCLLAVPAFAQETSEETEEQSTRTLTTVNQTKHVITDILSQVSEKPNTSDQNEAHNEAVAALTDELNALSQDQWLGARALKKRGQKITGQLDTENGALSFDTADERSAGATVSFQNGFKTFTRFKKHSITMWQGKKNNKVKNVFRVNGKIPRKVDNITSIDLPNQSLNANTQTELRYFGKNERTFYEKCHYWDWVYDWYYDDYFYKKVRGKRRVFEKYDDYRLKLLLDFTDQFGNTIATFTGNQGGVEILKRREVGDCKRR
jgi:hypothetical protein